MASSGIPVLRFLLPAVGGFALARWARLRNRTDEQTQPLPQEMLEISTNVIEYPEDNVSTVLAPGALRKELGLSAEVSSPKKCPDIRRPSPRLLKELVASMGDSPFLTLSDSNGSYHFYIHIRPGPTFHEIEKESGLSKPKLFRLFKNPYLFPFMFWSSMIGGGARVQPRESRKSMGMELTPARDPIEMSRVSMELYVPSFMPVPQSIPDSQIKFCVTMLAQTRYGHALTGSVLHVMFADQERVYFMWIGAGGGTPIIGGGLNNVLACNEYTGIWPMLRRNYCGFLTHPDVMRVTDYVLDDSNPAPIRKTKLKQLLRIVHENEGWAPYMSSLLAFPPDLWGQRVGSEVNGWWQNKKGQIKGV